MLLHAWYVIIKFGIKQPVSAAFCTEKILNWFIKTVRLNPVIPRIYLTPCSNALYSTCSTLHANKALVEKCLAYEPLQPFTPSSTFGWFGSNTKAHQFVTTTKIWRRRHDARSFASTGSVARNFSWHISSTNAKARLLSIFSRCQQNAIFCFCFAGLRRNEGGCIWRLADRL